MKKFNLLSTSFGLALFALLIAPIGANAGFNLDVGFSYSKGNNYPNNGWGGAGGGWGGIGNSCSNQGGGWGPPMMPPPMPMPCNPCAANGGWGPGGPGMPGNGGFLPPMPRPPIAMPPLAQPPTHLPPHLAMPNMGWGPGFNSFPGPNMPGPGYGPNCVPCGLGMNQWPMGPVPGGPMVGGGFGGGFGYGSSQSEYADIAYATAIGLGMQATSVFPVAVPRNQPTFMDPTWVGAPRDSGLIPRDHAAP